MAMAVSEGVIGAELIPPHAVVSDIRAELGRLTRGKRLRGAIATYITGKAGLGEKPLFKLTSLQLYGVSTLALIGSVGATYAALAFASPLAFLIVPYSMLVTTGRLRAQQVVFAHYAAAHDNSFSENKKINALVGDLATTLAMSQNPEEFRADHRKHHNKTVFTRPDDPDAAFLMSLGFRPGMPVSKAWSLLWKTMFSPRFHWKFIRARFLSTFRTTLPERLSKAQEVADPAKSENGPTGRRFKLTAWRRLLMGLTMMAILGALAITTPWWMFVLAVALPLGPLYNLSALLQFLSEHKWLHEPEGRLTSDQYKDACWDRFCGEPLPSAQLTGWRKWFAWTGWTARALCYHLPVRLAILIGDLPVHGWHHVRDEAGSGPTDWVHGSYARQTSIEDKGDPAGLAEREIWGLGNAIHRVFVGLSQSKLA
jgi:fatty acid desaturase